MISVYFLLSCLALHSSETKNVGQQFLKEPESIVVKEGDNVTLECSVSNKIGVLQWTKDGFGLGTSRSLSGYERYRMVGEQGKTWNLQISNITLEDDAKYQCQVGATDAVAPIRSNYATVKVLALPEPPVLTVGKMMVLEEGKIAMIQCISKGGNPASMIKWSLNGQLVTSGIEEKISKMKDARRMITVSTLTFPVTVNLSGSELVCEASNEVEEEPASVKTIIEVEFKPKVALTSDTEEIFEGDTVRLSCIAEANPNLIEYQWNIGGEEVKEAQGARELVIEATKDMNDKKITCLARNIFGQSSADYILNIVYSPSFVQAPTDVTGNNGDRIILQCQVDSNPKAEYVWMRNGDIFEMVGTGPLLSFTLSSLTAGSYTCQAGVPGFSPIMREAKVQMRGPPVILGKNGAQFGSVGETVHIHCETHSVPTAHTFKWSFNGEEITKDSQTFRIIETRDGARVKSTIIIKDAKKHHFGEYLCGVQNEIGQTETVIKLREIESLPLLIIMSAAISGLLLTIVGIVIVVTCRNVAKKQSDISSWPKTPNQEYRYSESSSEDQSQSNVTSSLTVEDADESLDSLPVNYSAFIKSENIPEFKDTFYHHQQQPDVVTSKNTIFVRDNHRKSNNYVVFNHYSSEQDLLECNNYSNPYVQSASPIGNSSTQSCPRNISPFYSNIPSRNDPRYTSGRDNAVIRYLEGEVSADELDAIKLGTHV